MFRLDIAKTQVRFIGLIFTFCFVFVCLVWINKLREPQVVVIEKKCDCTGVTNMQMKSNATNPQEKWADMATKYHQMVNSVQIGCEKIIHLGNEVDGGWDICDDEQYTPKPPCIIYSFGINNDWSFDDAVSKKYGCHVYAFDPSMKQNDHNRSDLIHFYKLGLAEREYTNSMGWKLNTLAGIRKKLGHSQAELRLLKMDIEKSELLALPEMINSGALKDVTQFVFEIHLSIFTSGDKEPDLARYELGVQLLQQIHDEGFRIFKTHQNKWSKFKSKFGMVRYGCHELHMVRVKASPR